MTSAARYKILEKIGAGSYATVYRARDLELGREVAIKQMHDEYLQDPARLDRYWQEAQLLASFQHPNIVTIYDIVRDRGWLIMELMQGNLAERLQGKQMDLRALRSMLAQVLRALKYLHSQGVIHGDVKPGNLMLDQRKRVKLGDFGLARRASDEQGSLLKGTTKYMAPEMVSEDFGDVGPASDLYSLGFSAYELMCGPNFDQLFPGLNAFGRNRQIAWMMWHAAADRKLPEISRVLDGVPPDIAQVVQKLTQKDQALRYKSADEALSDLQIDVKLVGTTEEQPTVAEPRSSDRRRITLAVGALAVSVLLSGLMLFWPSGSAKTTAAAQMTHGIVRSVEGTSLVLDEVDSAIPVEYKVIDKPKIFLLNDQKNILLKELQPGDHVEITTASENALLALSMTVDRPVTSRGTLKSVDLAGQRLILTLEEGNLRDDLPLRVPATAQLKLNGVPVALNELQAGDALLVRHLSEPGARKGRIVNALSARRAVTTVGQVVQFDGASGELTIEIGQGSLRSQKKLPVAAMCRVTINGQDASEGRALTASDLQAGDRVSLVHDVEILGITATRQLRADGVIDAASADGTTITVVTSDNKRHVLRIEPTTEVTLSLDRVSGADLRRFDDVRATYAVRGGGELVAVTIDARRAIQKDRWGIVIGTQSYADASVSPVKTAIDDARMMHSALLHRYGMSPDQCLLLVDAPKGDWERRIDEALGAARESMQVVIYIAGRAYQGEDGRTYLAAKDVELGRLRETGLPLDWLAEKLNGCAARDQVLILDVCPAGNGQDVQRQASGAGVLKGLAAPFQKAAVLLPCGGGEWSQVWPQKQRGLFAWTVARGFDGGADVDRDLKITPRELFDFVQRELRAEERIATKQTPALITP